MFADDFDAWLVCADLASRFGLLKSEPMLVEYWYLRLPERRCLFPSVSRILFCSCHCSLSVVSYAAKAWSLLDVVCYSKHPLDVLVDLSNDIRVYVYDPTQYS